LLLELSMYGTVYQILSVLLVFTLAVFKRCIRTVDFNEFLMC